MNSEISFTQVDPDTEAPGQAKKPAIFLVEDTRFFTNAVTKQIENLLDVTVVTASCLAEAKQILNSTSDEFFLSILDYRLPDAPGGEIVDYVASKGVPIIVYSADTSETVKEQIMSKKVIDYVLKDGPASLDRLTTLVSRLYNNQKVRVLVADDSDTTRQYLQDLLTQYQLQVEAAADGQEALEILEQNPDIKLLITDFYMPRLDGFQLIKEVRKTHPRSALAIIGMSSSGSNALSARFIKHGADDFINKPFLREEFFCRVSYNLDFIDLFEKSNSRHKELEVINRQKDQLFSIIAHDLRSPFHAILGFSELMSTQIDELSKEKISQYARFINDAGDQVSRVLNDLMEWSASQSEASNFTPEELDVCNAIDTVVSVVRPQATAKNIDLSYTVEENLASLADTRMLDTILRNLIGNAIKFTRPNGKININVKTSEQIDRIEITVEDNGVGMSRVRMAQLFRVGQTRSLKGTDGEPGTGLGLLLCNTFIKEHGGELTVHSVENEGSTFRFSIPAAPASQARAPEDSRKAALASRG